MALLNYWITQNILEFNDASYNIKINDGSIASVQNRYKIKYENYKKINKK